MREAMVTLAATLPVVVVAPSNNNNPNSGEGMGSDGRNSGASGGSDEDRGGIRMSGGTDAEFPVSNFFFIKTCELVRFECDKQFAFFTAT